MNRKVLTLLAGGALALVLGGGTAIASPSLVRPASAAIAAPSTPQPKSAQLQERGAKHHHRARFVWLLVKTTAQATGQTPRVVIQEVRGGQSLAQIAATHGSNSASIIQAARTKLQERLTKAVKAGRLTQDQADKVLARFDEVAPKIMNTTDLGKKFPQKP